MIHAGDIRNICGSEVFPVEVITGGSPCQDLSVAGSRKGLSGVRSGLFFEQIRVIREMLEATGGRYPRFAIWENVSGALSSNAGEDFKNVLEGFLYAKFGREIPIPAAKRWHRAGVIMYGLGYLGSFSLAWRIHDAQFWGVPQRRRRVSLVVDFRGQSAPEILFEPEGLPRGPSPSRTQKEPGARAYLGNPETTVSAINTDAHESGISILQDRLHTLRACIRESVFDGRLREDVVCPTLTGDHENRVSDYTALCIGNGQTNQGITDKVGILTTTHDQQAICSRELIRRLTPLECERTQGFPDGWTDIGAWRDSRGKLRATTDTARYRALGNSIALPFWCHLMRRVIEHCEERTLGSLFDGIGGFPLAWHQAGGIAVWASEIDEFCIAVTEQRINRRKFEH